MEGRECGIGKPAWKKTANRSRSKKSVQTTISFSSLPPSLPPSLSYLMQQMHQLGQTSRLELPQLLLTVPQSLRSENRGLHIVIVDNVLPPSLPPSLGW